MQKQMKSLQKSDAVRTDSVSIWDLLVIYGSDYKVESLKDLLLATRLIERQMAIEGETKK